MIKKIDANEYGVVKYAITSVDELNRLPKKIAPSSQAILIENGLRVFVYGDGQWVEEVVDGDLSENMQSIVADYERSKIGYDGVKRGSLGERLKDDFQGIYDILNARDYCEYSGKELKVDNTWMGNQIDTRVEGRTLQNLIPTEWIVNSNVGGHATYNVDTKVISAICDGSYSHARFYGDSFLTLIRAGLTYTICFKTRRVGSSVDRRINLGKYDSDGNIPYIRGIRFTINEGVAQHIYSFRVLDSYENTDGTQLRFTVDSISDGSLDIYDIVLLEGDYTQTPLSELPYFEGIESVGEREIGKNLLDPSELEYGNMSDGVAGNTEGNRKRSGFMKVKPNTNYVFSSNLGEVNVNWWFYDINKKYISKGGYCQTITTPSNCEYIRIHNGHADGTPLSDFKLQVEEGTVATEYEPFGYKIKGKSCGKNLIDARSGYTAMPDYLNGVIKNDVLTLDINPQPNTTRSVTYQFELKDIILNVGDIYAISGKVEFENVANIRILMVSPNTTSNTASHYIFGEGEFKGNLVVKEALTHKESLKYQYPLSIEVNVTPKDYTQPQKVVLSNFQLEKNDHATPYEPYQESTYSIHSPIPLRSLPDGVCDVYDFESGAVIQRVGKVVLDGTQKTIRRADNSDEKINTSHFSFNDYRLVDGSSILCDKLVQRQNNALISVDNMECLKESGSLWINVYKTNADTVEELRTYLSINPMTVYYELQEPIIHYLTPSQLKSFDGTTHVISENTLIPTTTTKILTDTYTNVSNVNSTAYSLRRGVNGVAETSAIINETDVEQDDVLDVTMCAIDELYSMLEPNLE